MREQKINKPTVLQVLAMTTLDRFGCNLPTSYVSVFVKKVYFDIPTNLFFKNGWGSQ